MIIGVISTRAGPGFSSETFFFTLFFLIKMLIGRFFLREEFDEDGDEIEEAPNLDQLNAFAKNLPIIYQ